MTLVEFGKASTHKLWKYVLTDWEGDTYACPVCAFETITNEGTIPAFNYCPMCGKNMIIDDIKEQKRKEKRTEYNRNYQRIRRIRGRDKNDIYSNRQEDR